VTVDAVDLLRRLLREGPELTVTDEEFAYCQRLASEEEGT
jgi:hypothetical protein